MKIDDVVEGQDYARKYGGRARVVEITTTERRGAPKVRRLTLQMLRPDGTPQRRENGTEVLVYGVPASRLASTWDDYLAEQDAYRIASEHAAELEQEAEEARGKLTAQLRDAHLEMGYGKAKLWTESGNVLVRLTPSQAVDLANQLALNRQAALYDQMAQSLLPTSTEQEG